MRHQTLLGVTGSGKTYTMAQTIQQHQKPTLVLAHNKTLAAQLYAEFREFFPDNAVEYFVSYFDYYQPEAYLPRSDTYIEKDSSRNEEIDRLRHAATHALFERRDVIIVASVSCIYGLGAPVDYGATVLRLRTGGQYRRDAVLRHLVDLQYQRNDAALTRARFRVRGDTLEIGPASVRDHRPGRVLRRRGRADHGARPADRRAARRAQGAERLPGHPLRDAARQAPARDRGASRRRWRSASARWRPRDGRSRRPGCASGRRSTSRCCASSASARGVENYSRHLSQREPGRRPWTLLDYFPPDWLLIVDESHMTIPQVVGMYKNDRTRKEILVDFGFRLPSALDNRPLTFEEFEVHVNQAIYVSATPGPYELREERADRSSS